MPTFDYQARDRRGTAMQGTIDAATSTEANQALRGRGLLVLALTTSRAQRPLSSPGWNPLHRLPPRAKDVIAGFQQLAVMLRSGLTLLQALRAAAEHASRWTMGVVWNNIADRLIEGTSFSEAMRHHSCFPNLSLQLVKVGEQTGNLESMLTKAAEMMERRRALINSMMAALAYPAVVLVASVGVTGFLVFWVIPKLSRFLSSLGRSLPGPTQLLVDVSMAVQEYAQVGLITLIVLFIALVLVYRWPNGRYAIDWFCLRIPIVGKLLRLGNTALFARGLGILVASGVTLLEALRSVEGLLGNRYVSRRIALARDGVLRGESLAKGLTDSVALMPLLTRIVAVGEATGTLDSVLGESADYHDAQLQRMIRWLSVIIEPVIIIIVGGIVGFVYISFFLALFAIAGRAG